MRHLYTNLFIVIFFLISWEQVKAQPNEPGITDSVKTKEKLYSVFLIGDAGTGWHTFSTPVVNLLQRQVDEVGEKGSVVFLGNTASPKNLQPGNEQTDVLTAIKNFNGKTIILPGNQEWDSGRKNGWQQVQVQEKFIEDLIQKENVFLPDGGCPGPVEINLNDQLTLVVLDTQWWLHPWEKPESDSECEAKSASEILILLEDILERNKNKKVVVAGHHPTYSYGRKGSYNPPILHLFPLTDLYKSLYVPLPVLGSLYTFYRRNVGTLQDIPHPRNRVQRNAMVEIFRKHPNIVYANGHDHTLQYIQKDSVHYIISGTGSTTDYLRKKRKNNLYFGATQSGFARLDYLRNGEVWLTFWTAAADQPNGTIVYKKKIDNQSLAPVPTKPLVTQVRMDTIVISKPSGKYEAGKLKTKLLGQNYRAVWQEPATFPVFDLDTQKGGLTIIKRGGGLQTKSLRLRAKDGRQYVLRSVDKDPALAIPEALRETFAADVVQDQISASHPYAALAVPPLAQAAGVNTSHPVIVFVPDDPRFGKYQKLFANTLCILEERPDDVLNENQERVEKVYSTTNMLEKVYANPDNQVNQQEVLRARLFDMVIGDWDRHDDQWRWKSKKTEKGTYFYPLPRDRDQVFFVNEGIIPNIASRKWVMPKFQGFDYQVRDVAGFNFNARYFDRSFLNELSLADWLAMVDTLQARLTDQAIDQAISAWPERVQQISGAEIKAKLKSRRNNLKKDAQTYYQFLAKTVDVTGTDKDEYFQVVRINPEQTELKVFKLNKKQEVKDLLYHRIFSTSETKEIRLYGLGGQDQFNITGNVPKSIKVRIIGGPGTDRITDSSFVKGSSKKTWVYDNKEGNILALTNESKNRTSVYPTDNEYDRKAFKYDYLGPLASVQYNPDDGLFLGAGVLYKKQGFRKSPYAATHKLTANYAFQTSAYNINYKGRFTDVFRKLDFEQIVDVKGPSFVNNFFGFGNETVYNEDEQDIRFYYARVSSIKSHSLLIKNIFGSQKVFIGPAFETYQVENTPNRFISLPGQNEQHGNSLFRQKNYAGLKLGFQFDNRDNPVLPNNGTYWHTEGGIFKGINAYSGNYAKIESDLSFYWSFRLPARFTLATRFGGGLNIGDYEFFQANTLGGLSNLRGYRRTRFTGESSLYNNTDLRLRLFNFKAYVFSASLGILAFHDVGRVWADGEDSRIWHNSAGGGIWLAPFSQTVISFMYGISKEDQLPLLKVGFLF